MVRGFCVYLNSVVGVGVEVELEMGLFVSLWVSGFVNFVFLWVCRS